MGYMGKLAADNAAYGPKVPYQNFLIVVIVSKYVINARNPFSNQP